MKLIQLAVGALVALNGVFVATGAQVIVYDSFGAGNSYNSGVAWAVSGASTSGGYRGQAEFFVPGTSGYLAGIQVATIHLSGSLLSNFYIAQDNGSGIPGAILETYSNVVNANGTMSIGSATHPLLQAGQEYWLCDEPATSDANNGWYENSQNVANGFAFERSEWSWSAITGSVPPSGVFRVTVTPVPEPTAAGLMALGGGWLGFRLRRLRASK